MMSTLLYWGIIFCIWNVNVRIIQKLDPPNWIISPKQYWIFVGWSGINAVVISSILCVDGMTKLLLAIFGGCLLFACITDCKTCEVYQFTWWIAGAAGGGIFCKMLSNSDGIGIASLGTLLFFGLLQETFFCKFYGRADCHAFVVSALAIYGMGMELRNCLNHMLYAFVGVAIVQLFRHNINRRGNLKRPVAFIPYITVAFWINLCCFSLKKVIY